MSKSDIKLVQAHKDRLVFQRIIQDACVRLDTNGAQETTSADKYKKINRFSTYFTLAVLWLLTFAATYFTAKGFSPEIAYWTTPLCSLVFTYLVTSKIRSIYPSTLAAQRALTASKKNKVKEALADPAIIQPPLTTSFARIPTSLLLHIVVFMTVFFAMNINFTTMQIALFVTAASIVINFVNNSLAKRFPDQALWLGTKLETALFYKNMPTQSPLDTAALQAVLRLENAKYMAGRVILPSVDTL